MQLDGGRFAEGPELSVVIPTHNRSAILRTTLQRLSATGWSERWEIVVVANACTDDTAAVVDQVNAESALSARVVEEARPSASVARNRGAREAKAGLLVFLDDDILLEPDGLAKIVEWYGGTDGKALLVGQVRPLPEHAATPFGAFRQRALGGASWQTDQEEVDWFASGLAAVPTRAFQQLGGYEESYPAAGLEDADFAIRARRSGLQIVYDPTVVGVHNDWAGTTARDYCRRAAVHCATAPLLAERFPDQDHPWGRLVEVNRPAVPSDTAEERLRKGLKGLAVGVGADRWLPIVADAVKLPQRPRELLFKISVSLAMFAGYQRGLARMGSAAAPLSAHRAQTVKKLSIVIVTFNCVDEVERALESLRHHPSGVASEVVVVDNASQDGTVDRLRRRFPEVEVIEMDENVGYGAAVNRGVKETTGDHLLLLNPDTEVTTGAIDTLLHLATTTDRAGVVGPRLELATGDPQPSARRLPSPWRAWIEVLRLHLLLPAGVRSRLLAGTYSRQDRRGRVDWVSGACHLVPRHVWERVGGLTERTFCGFDDLDFCWRAGDAGFETWYCPEAVVLHQCGASVGRRWTPSEIDALAIHNIYVVLQSHWGRARVKLYCAAELVGTLSDLVLGVRGGEPTRAAARRYRTAALRRARLLTQLLLGRIRPAERHEPGLDRPVPSS